MKAPPTKRVGRAPLKNDAATASNLAKPTPEALIVERLQRLLAELDRLPLPVGELGCQFLDCLELTDKIREKVRGKARELLLREPGGIIPHWHVSETAQRVLSKETLEVFDALARADDTLTAERFIDACTVSLGAIRKLFSERNAGMSVDEVEFTLNRTLENLIHHEMVARLVRSKDRQLELSL